MLVPLIRGTTKYDSPNNQKIAQIKPKIMIVQIEINLEVENAIKNFIYTYSKLTL